MPGTGSVCMVLVSLTTLGLGPSIFVDFSVYYNNWAKILDLRYRGLYNYFERYRDAKLGIISN